jgi:hypothetical protein
VLSPPLQGQRATLSLRASATLCLAPGEGSLLQLAPCNASLPPTQAWRATGTQVVLADATWNVEEAIRHVEYVLRAC